MEEVLDYVLWEIRRSGYERKLIGGIVFTGGGSLLNNVDKLTEFHTGMSCRIGVPVEHLGHGYQEKVCSPIFATGLGLLLSGLEEVESGYVSSFGSEARSDKQAPSNVSEEKSASWLENIFQRTKEWFEAEPDLDFNK